MDSIYHINSKSLDLATIQDIVSTNKKLQLSEPAKEKIIKCRLYLDENYQKVINPFMV